MNIAAVLRGEPERSSRSVTIPADPSASSAILDSLYDLLLSPGQVCSLRDEALTISTRGGADGSRWRAATRSIASRARIQSTERS